MTKEAGPTVSDLSDQTDPTKDDAVAYAEKQGMAYHIVPAAPVSLKIQAYADNFR